MSNAHQKTFSIVNNVNRNTIPQGGTEADAKQFGEKYAGSFSVRRPSLGDKQQIAIKKAAILNRFGFVDPNLIKPSIQMSIHAFAFITTVATAPLPDWFDPEKLFTTDDEYAVMAVWEEVSQWLEASFPE